MRQPAFGTVRARSIEVMLDGLRPTLVADLRVEVIGAPATANYEVGPAFAGRAARGADASAGVPWTCRGEGCAVPLDTASGLYPLEVRYALDQTAEAVDLERPLLLRFEIRERDASGRVRLVAATEPESLEVACGRLGRVPLQLRRIARVKPGPEGEIAVRAIRVIGGCEGPVLYADLDHRVIPMTGTRPVVRIAVGLAGSPRTACGGPNCEAALEPPDEGSITVEKPLGLAFAALGRSVTRAEIHLFLERRPLVDVPGDGTPAGLEAGFLDHHVYELISPGAGGVM